DAVDDERRRLEAAACGNGVGLKRPLRSQTAHVVGRDLRQRAVTLARVVARVLEPPRRALESGEQVARGHALRSNDAVPIELNLARSAAQRAEIANDVPKILVAEARLWKIRHQRLLLGDDFAQIALAISLELFARVYDLNRIRVFVLLRTADAPSVVRDER